MRPIPDSIDGASVLRVANLEGVTPTGRTRHIVGAETVRDFAQLAIVRYEDQPGVYLLYCDVEWRAVTDTYHETIEDAIGQAEFEFGPLEFERVVQNG